MWSGDSLFKERDRGEDLRGEKEIGELERRELYLSCVGVKVVWMRIVWVKGDLERFLLRGFVLEECVGKKGEILMRILFQ